MNQTVPKSKKQIAGIIYLKCTELGLKRKEIIIEMVVHAALSFSGASTYYQNFKSGQWNPQPKAEDTAVGIPSALVAVNFNAMSEIELLEYYNAHANIKLTGFVNRADALAMVNRLG